MSRPHLLKELEEAKHRKLTLISAPAGYGKTTLLSEWVPHAGIPLSWLSLDSADNDPGRFWSHFIAAMRSNPSLQVNHEVEDFLDRIQNNPYPENKAAFQTLLTQIAGTRDPFILVMDDLHLLSTVEILDGLWFLVENLPHGMSGMHFVLSSRMDPPWPLARLRVQGQINEIRAKDLRFTKEETTQFLNQVMNLGLPAQAINQLDQRTEGWAAGLQMAALAMEGGKPVQDEREIARFLEGFGGGHHFILDYLVEEVLNSQPEPIVDFLLKTSILEQLNGSLCAVITGDNNSSERLLQLENSNMFLVALDDQRNWYRYHHLFRDLLRKQLLTRYPNLVPELHRRASDWYEEAGYKIDAVSHAIETKDWPFAVKRIEGHILNLIQQGNIILTGEWVRSLPVEVIRPRPILCLAQAWASARYDTLALAEQMLAQAEDALSVGLDQDKGLEPAIKEILNNQIAVLQVVIARARGDSTQQQLELALNALDRLDHTEDTASRATLFFRLGLCSLDLRKFNQADRNFSQAIKLGKESGNKYAVYAANYGRMVILQLKGQLKALGSLCDIERVDQPGGENLRGPLIGIDWIMYGRLCYEWNDLDQAEWYLTQGLERITEVGLIELQVKGQFSLACLKIALGKFDPMLNIAQIAAERHPRLAAYAEALGARVNLALAVETDDPSAPSQAAEWAKKQSLELKEPSTYDWEVQGKLVLARYLCWQFRRVRNEDAANQLREVLDFLQDQRKCLQDFDWNGPLIELDAVLAVILHTLDENEKALLVLERALRLAEGERFIRTFVDEGKPMRGLLQQLFNQGVLRSYIQQILTAFEQKGNADREIEKRSRDHVFEPLSDRELQVLRTLNSTLSVPEIAAEIYLAPSTVRTHIQNIYRKLDVHRRSEAIQRAKDIGLL